MPLEPQPQHGNTTPQREPSHVSLISSLTTRLSSLTESRLSESRARAISNIPTVHLPTRWPPSPVGSAYGVASRTHMMDADGPQSKQCLLPCPPSCLIQQAEGNFIIYLHTANFRSSSSSEPMKPNHVGCPHALNVLLEFRGYLADRRQSLTSITVSIFIPLKRLATKERSSSLHCHPI